MKTATRKIFAAVLTAAAVLSLGMPAAYAADKNFSDVPVSHWAYSEIMSAADRGITTGYTDGTFKPTASVTEIQFAVMLSRTFYQSDIASNQSNAAGKAWYWANLKALAEHGLLNGTAMADEANWAARGNGSISRYEMAVLMNNVMTGNGRTVSTSERSAAGSQIGDWNFIPPDYRDAVAACYALGILNGQSDGTFGGESPMNRAQGCVVINRMLSAIDGNGGTAAPAGPVEPSEPEQPAGAPAADGTLSNGKAITVENVLELIDELREKYPEGTIYAPVGEKYDTDAIPGCSFAEDSAGWAAMASDYIFGKGTNPSHELTDHSRIRPGDMIMLYDSSAHKYGGYTVFVTGDPQACTSWNDPDGQAVTIAESDPSHEVRWIDDTYHLLGTCEAAANELDMYWVVYTRYPD